VHVPKGVGNLPQPADQVDDRLIDPSQRHCERSEVISIPITRHGDCRVASLLTRLRGFAVRKRYFLRTGARYQFDIPRRYSVATAENRCSEDLPYSHALIRVPTIVQRELELAQRQIVSPDVV
jgi:hypothetical protein